MYDYQFHVPNSALKNIFKIVYNYLNLLASNFTTDAIC